MEVTTYLKDKGVKALEEEIAIVVKEYDDLYVLNYNQIESPKDHPITKECRGLILDKDFNVVSRSFDRFFNYGECTAGENLGISECSVVEKVDGSLIKIYFYKGIWHVSTRGTAYAESNVADFGLTFQDLVWKSLNVSDEGHFQSLCNDHLYPENTYIFEVTSRENRVVTRYEGYTLWSLGCRNNETGEYSQPQHIENFGAKLPKTYNFKSIDDMLEASKALPDLAEGYVLYREGIPQCKVKSPLYLTVHRIRGEGSLTNKRVMQLLLMNEQDEYLTYYPEDERFFEAWINCYEALLCRISATYDTYKHIEDQKQFALKVKDELFSAVLFQSRNKGEHPVRVWHQQREAYKLKVLEEYSLWVD